MSSAFWSCSELILIARRSSVSIPLQVGNTPKGLLGFCAARTSLRLINHDANGAQGSQPPQQTDLPDVYRGLVATGCIKYDEDQVRVVVKLRRLSKTLRDYAPPAFVSQYYQPARISEDSATKNDNSKPWYSATKSTKSTLAENTRYASVSSVVRLRSQAEVLAELRTPKGLLLTGPPGCGKSFLVDLWLATLPTPFKTRKHYSELVLEIYRGVWEETRHRKALLYSQTEETGDSKERPRSAWTKAVREHWRNLLQAGALPTSWRPAAQINASASSHRHITPPIAFTIAHRLVTQHWLLVFDELQLLDVSSAGLLADVLAWFWRMGGVVVASSNKVPDELYRGGVQRERLEPFVEALKVRCPVLVMRGKGDWRRERSSDVVESYWFTTTREDEFWTLLSVLMNGSPSTNRELNVFGRRLLIPHSSGSTCRFTFSELCDKSLGPADYITIAAHYQTLVITSIPVLRVSAKNQSRRFISLIDALYEARCRVVALAEAEPDELFFPDAVASYPAGVSNDASSGDQLMAEAFSESREVFRPNVSSYEDKPERPVASPLSLESLSIFSGEEERFAYKRALSRLIEMTSDHYAKNDQWKPLSTSSRKWEGINSSSSDSLPIDRTSEQEVREAFGGYAAALTGDGSCGDFAAEAAYESEGRLQRMARERPSAPRLGENHAWGVREDWGEKAGKWGKGAAAFDDGAKQRK